MLMEKENNSQKLVKDLIRKREEENVAFRKLLRAIREQHKKNACPPADGDAEIPDKESTDDKGISLTS